ncbi:MAG: NAD-dependent epimerase/dehydratase family protein, partial [Gammaproteobacteria bacterium]|nr:NAD-dependent epimerase/dehydratase family protein [Gammaproteobacteria bacterium]
MMSKQICILGGSGFLGRYLIESLTRKNFLVRVATRHRERNRHLLVNPNVSLIEADIHNEEALHSLFSGCEVVINLVGILNGSQEQLRKTHIELPQKIVSVCNRIGVKRLLHMSALQAGSANAMSQYLRSKGEGENIAHHQSSHHLNVTSFRPSTIFGEGDHLFNRFASMAKMSPIIPMV